MKSPTCLIVGSPAVLFVLGAALAVGVGCGDDDSGGGDEDTSQQDAAMDTDGDTQGPATGPVLDRPPQVVASCSVSSPLTRIPDASWYTTSMAQTSDGAMWLAYGGWQRGGFQAAVTPVAADGTFGTALALDDLGETIHLAADGDRLAVSFDRASAMGQPRFAVANADGTLTVAPRDADAVGAMVPVEGGFAMVTAVTDPGANVVLRLRILDEDGDTTAGPTQVAALPGYGSVFAEVVSVPGGVAVAWAEREPGAVRVAWFGADGVATRDPVTLGGGHGEGWSVGVRLALLSVDDALWIAWSEATYGEDFGQGRAEIRVAVIDPNGSVREAPMAAAEVDLFRTAPRLVNHGGVPGLTWSEGTFIYICGGCISDYDAHFVLLGRDAAGEVVPASDVTVIPHQDNGITTRFIASSGDDLVFVTQLDFHAISFPALATITCLEGG